MLGLEMAGGGVCNFCFPLHLQWEEGTVWNDRGAMALLSLLGSTPSSVAIARMRKSRAFSFWSRYVLAGWFLSFCESWSGLVRYAVDLMATDPPLPPTSPTRQYFKCFF